MKHGAQSTIDYLGRATFLHTIRVGSFPKHEENHPPKTDHVVERTLFSRIKSIPTLSYIQEVLTFATTSRLMMS